MASKLLLTACVIGALGIATACVSDSLSAPGEAAPRSAAAIATSLAANAGSTGTDTVIAISRRAPLEHDVSVAATIGPSGGSLVIVEAGVMVSFPPGALTSDKRITMTAKAGWAVAYEFCPHGITFDAPVVVAQDLSYAQVAPGRLNSLQAGYYASSLPAIYDPGNSHARVSEVRGAKVDQSPGARIATFYISHFSGYIMSSGFADGGGGSDMAVPQP
jgi:hypothetical protein